MADSRTNEPPRSPLIRPRDQASVLALAASALVLMAALWFKHGGHRGGLVDVERAPPLVAKFQVNVNRADWPELIQLPGVGPILAQKWIAERERNGPFRDLDDLSRVRGIGPRTMQRLRPYLAPILDEADVARR